MRLLLSLRERENASFGPESLPLTLLFCSSSFSSSLHDEDKPSPWLEKAIFVDRYEWANSIAIKVQKDPPCAGSIPILDQRQNLT